jgi:hypothetical protein
MELDGLEMVLGQIQKAMGDGFQTWFDQLDEPGKIAYRCFVDVGGEPPGFPLPLGQLTLAHEPMWQDHLDAQNGDRLPPDPDDDKYDGPMVAPRPPLDEHDQYDGDPFHQYIDVTKEKKPRDGAVRFLVRERLKNLKDPDKERELHALLDRLEKSDEAPPSYLVKMRVDRLRDIDKLREINSMLEQWEIPVWTTPNE